MPTESPVSASKTLPVHTLILGAGVSTGLVPCWNQLVKKIESDSKAPANGAHLCESSTAPFPNDGQVRLELAWRSLREKLLAQSAGSDKGDNADEPLGQRMLGFDRKAETAWNETLRDALYDAPSSAPFADYAAQRKPGGMAARIEASTLHMVADMLGGETTRHSIDRVISFNADDWLEFELWRRSPPDFHDRFRVVTHPTFGPSSASYEQDDEGEAVASYRKVPIVHAHGFLCHPGEKDRSTYSASKNGGRMPSFDAPNMLVFRDLDYWRMTANPSSFANHTLLQAMASTRCIFVGLSMRDLNLLRWLGALAAEHEDAWRARWHLHFQEGRESVRMGNSWAARRINHVWLTEIEDTTLHTYMGFRGIDMRTVAWPKMGGGAPKASDELGSILAGSS